MSRKNDYVFKRIFGDERNKPLLIDLLNAIIDEDVEDVVILNPEFRKEHNEDYFGILDIKAQTRDGTFVDIEIQINPTLAYDKRILYYWAKLFSEQLKKGHIYNTLKKTIAISIIDYNSFNDKVRHHKFELYDTQNQILFTDVMEIHFLELKKLESFSSEALESGRLDHLDEWLYFIETKDKEVLEMLSKKNSSIKYAYDLVDIMSKSEVERRAYEDRENALHERASYIDEYYSRGLAEGKEVGKEEGRQEGREEGREEGRQEGREEAKHEVMVNIIKNMLSKGMTLESISEITGLSLDEIRPLLDE